MMAQTSIFILSQTVWTLDSAQDSINCVVDKKVYNVYFMNLHTHHDWIMHSAHVKTDLRDANPEAG